MTNDDKDLKQQLIELAWEIEKLPASEQQTKVITMLTDIRSKATPQQPSEPLKELDEDELAMEISTALRAYNVTEGSISLRPLKKGSVPIYEYIAKAIFSALPAQREVRYPEKEYCGKINTALHNDNCEECKYHKLRNKLIDKMKKLNGG